MIKKAIILDLDNTIYPVSSIGDKLFKSLFELIEKSGEYKGGFEKLKAEIMRRPFQYVAKEFEFSEKLFDQSLKLLENLTYDEPMDTFDDYKFVRHLKIDKFLVTAGFTKMQESKVHQLGIADDFKAIYIIDPAKTNLVKKDMFIKIMLEYNFRPTELLVAGDDINSEIKAALELGIDAVLYDRAGTAKPTNEFQIIKHFSELKVV